MVTSKHLSFLVDFVILDIKANLKCLLMLGRPFLVNSNTKINVEKGRITLKISQTATYYKQNREKEQESCTINNISHLTKKKKETCPTKNMHKKVRGNISLGNHKKKEQ